MFTYYTHSLGELAVFFVPGKGFRQSRTVEKESKLSMNSSTKPNFGNMWPWPDDGKFVCPGHLLWRFGPWRCNCFIVPNTCPWPFSQCLGKNLGKPPESDFWGARFDFLLLTNRTWIWWGAKMRNDLNHQLGPTNGRLGGFAFSPFFCVEHWVCLSIILPTNPSRWARSLQIAINDQPIFFENLHTLRPWRWIATSFTLPKWQGFSPRTR